ncbi:MAG: hypothetical protein ABEJ56_05250 [Candidatus Nanohaloarchaea archaeon]
MSIRVGDDYYHVSVEIGTDGLDDLMNLLIVNYDIDEIEPNEIEIDVKLRDLNEADVDFYRYRSEEGTFYAFYRDKKFEFFGEGDALDSLLKELEDEVYEYH